MSSNIEIQRICEYCNDLFIARTTKTKYCSHRCNSKHYKERVKFAKIENNNKETKERVTFSLEALKAKEFLTVKDVATLLSCSKGSIYNSIDSGNIEVVNFGQRLTRIKRSSLDEMFIRNKFI